MVALIQLNNDVQEYLRGCSFLWTIMRPNAFALHPVAGLGQFAGTGLDAQS